MQDFFLNHPNNKIVPSISNEVLANSNSMNFHTNLKDYNCTPFVSLKSLANELKINNLFVKDESQRFGLNAFKVLGASYAVYQLLNTDLNYQLNQLYHLEILAKGNTALKNQQQEESLTLQIQAADFQLFY